MPSEASRQPAIVSAQQPALSFQLSRNVIVQGLGMAMVSLMGLAVLPWPLVTVWTGVAIASVAAENRLMRIIAGDGPSAPRAIAWSSSLRVLTTTIYALAALALIAKGGPGERLFAFSLMSASMVHVLMRYYRSPKVLAAGLAPYLIILALVGWGVTQNAIHNGRYLSALASTFTVAMFSVQFWSARAQLFAAWVELMAAREAAEARAHAAAAASRAKSDFLTNMSHELRTPLNGVLGMAQALTTGDLSPIQKERVGIIRRSSESLLSVLNDLVDLSKVETGALELEMAEFDLEHLVRGVVAAYRPVAVKKGLTFDLSLVDEARRRYRGDSARIRRILYSLADNAVKFTASGHITLEVDRDEDAIIFRVSDTGIGISEEDRTRLFEGFYQADATLTRRYGGAGIGLAVCTELTGLMGGTISAESEPGHGSTFILRLPLDEVPVAVETVPPQERLAEQSGELRVLAAEDNEVNQMVLKTLLAPAGITPMIVENGREAVAAWEGQTWDVILMDIQMPEMNGIEATRAIRSRERETGRSRTPIIAVTANAMTHQIAEYEVAGMDGVVPKPIDMVALFEVIEQVLADEPAAAETREQLAS